MAGKFPLGLVPLKVGAVVRESIAAVMGPSASVRLKWPNDVLIEGKKVSGVLIEMDSGNFLIGVGCNVGVAPEVPKSGKEMGRESGRLLDWMGGEEGGLEGGASTEEIVADLAASISSKVSIRVVRGELSWLLAPFAGGSSLCTARKLSCA